MSTFRTVAFLFVTIYLLVTLLSIESASLPIKPDTMSPTDMSGRMQRQTKMAWPEFLGQNGEQVVGKIKKETGNWRFE